MRTWRHLDSETCEGTFWMAQEYVPSLSIIGEWRVFVIGGRMVAMVHTYRKKTTRAEEWFGEEADAFLTLDEVS